MFIPVSYQKRNQQNSINEMRDVFKEQITEIIDTIIKDKPMFSLSNFSFYYFDETTLNTNTNEYPINNLYVEINQPKNIKELSIEKKNNKNKTPELYLTLKEFKNAIRDLSVARFDNNTLVWEDKYSINFAINIYDHENPELKTTYYFRVVPCLTYKNENNSNGVIYYNENKSLVEIEYPKLSIFNHNIKNKETNGLYSNYVVMFKNFFMAEKKEKDIPFEFFEILLYNVPNELYIDDSQANVLKVLNYMRNLSIKEFKSLDDQSKAFTDPYKSLSIIYANHALKKLSAFIKKQTN